MSEATTTLTLPERQPAEHYTMAQWLGLKADYIKGKGILTHLCKLHGINYQTAKTRSAKEKWERKQKAWFAAQSGKLELDQPLASDTKPQPETPEASEIATTENQLRMVNDSLIRAIFPRDVADLTKAKMGLIETLHVLKHGAKPGTLKPVAQTKPKRSQTYAEPQPIAMPEPLQIASQVTPSPVAPTMPGQLAANQSWRELLF